jgi:hypothetical protein
MDGVWGVMGDDGEGSGKDVRDGNGMGIMS